MAEVLKQTRCYPYAFYYTKGGSTLALTVIYGVLVIGSVCLLALAGLELVQRLVPADSRRQHNDVAGFIYAALGVILRRPPCSCGHRRLGAMPGRR
jgi:hypothetical protein